MKRVFACVVTCAMFQSGSLVLAQPSPLVKMAVTVPDGQIKELTVPESGLATFTLKDGTEIGVRPTILDSKPWTRVVVTFFKMPTPTHGVEEIGLVETKTAGPVVIAKTTPPIKVAVLSVSEPSASSTATR